MKNMIEYLLHATNSVCELILKLATDYYKEENNEQNHDHVGSGGRGTEQSA